MSNDIDKAFKQWSDNNPARTFEDAFNAGTAYGKSTQDDYWARFKDHEIQRLKFEIEQLRGMRDRECADKIEIEELYKQALCEVFELKTAPYALDVITKLEKELAKANELIGIAFKYMDSVGYVTSYQGEDFEEVRKWLKEVEDRKQT